MYFFSFLWIDALRRYAYRVEHKQMFGQVELRR